MATMQRTATTLQVSFTRAEKLAGLVRDVQIPLTAVLDAEVVQEPMSTLRGLRAPGFALPGIRKIGTWRGHGERVLVSVRAGQPAVRIRLAGGSDSLLIGADDAAQLAALLTGSR